MYTDKIHQFSHGGYDRIRKQKQNTQQEQFLIVGVYLHKSA